MSFMGILGAAMGGAAEAGFKFKSAEAEKRRKEALIKMQEDRQDARTNQQYMNQVALSMAKENSADARLDKELQSRENIARAQADKARAPVRQYYQGDDGTIYNGFTGEVKGQGGETLSDAEYQQRREAYIKKRLDEVDGMVFGIGSSLEPWGGSEERAKIDFGKEFDTANGRGQPMRTIPSGSINLPGQATPKPNQPSSNPAATPTEAPVATPGEGRPLDSIVNFGSTVRNEGVGGIIGNAFNSMFGPSENEMTPALRSKVSAAIQALSAGDKLDPTTAQEVYPHLPPAFQKKLEQQSR